MSFSFRFFIFSLFFSNTLICALLGTLSFHHNVLFCRLFIIIAVILRKGNCSSCHHFPSIYWQIYLTACFFFTYFCVISLQRKKYNANIKKKKVLFQMPAAALLPELKQALMEHRKARNFDAAAWVEMKCRKLNDYMRRCGLKACVTSVSGGIDSAVVLAMCARAMQASDSPIQKNIGLCQPIHSSAWALERGKENIAACGATEVVVDQTALHGELAAMVEKAVGIEGGDFARGQLRSYMRTPPSFYMAQLLSQEGMPAIVMGTGNKDEDFYLGYFCKAGDGVVDVQIISDLHKSEVFAVAEVLGVPANTRKAAPSADLWEAQTDEDELGFPYDFVELFTGWYLEQGEAAKLAFLDSLSPEGRKQFEQYTAACELVHRRNAHKLKGQINL